MHADKLGKMSEDNLVISLSETANWPACSLLQISYGPDHLEPLEPGIASLTIRLLILAPNYYSFRKSNEIPQLMT